MTGADVQTVPEQLAARVAENPDADFVSFDGGAWITISQARSAGRRLATGLHRLGVRPGDRIASIMSNRPEAVEVFLACAELGAVQVPVNVFLKGEFLRYQLTDADPAAIVVDADGLDAVRAIMDEAGIEATLVALDPTDTDAVRYLDLLAEEAVDWAAPTADSLMSIMYTSGTTGAPKGCMITQGYFLHMPLAHREFGWFTPADTSISTLPLYHGFGVSALMDAIVIGCRVAYESEFRASTLIARAREVGATQLWAVGAIGAALLATPASAADRDHGLERAVFIPMAPEPQRIFEERFGLTVLAEGYGQTEVLPATMGGARTDRTGPTCGKALPWLEVAVVDERDRVLPIGAAGEIVVRPKEPHSMFSGYWRKDAQTLESWSNLWHHTGDMGRFGEDGYLSYVDRKKDALRRRGENVSSIELEQAILRHPSIAAVAVHAVPSALSEDDIKACIVLGGERPEIADLFEFFRSTLPYYAIPKYVEFVQELPVNAMGRVLKHRMRDEWDTPDTLDLERLGFTVAKADRR